MLCYRQEAEAKEQQQRKEKETLGHNMFTAINWPPDGCCAYFPECVSNVPVSRWRFWGEMLCSLDAAFAPATVRYRPRDIRKASSTNNFQSVWLWPLALVFLVRLSRWIGCPWPLVLLTMFVSSPLMFSFSPLLLSSFLSSLHSPLFTLLSSFSTLQAPKFERSMLWCIHIVIPLRFC